MGDILIISVEAVRGHMIRCISIDANDVRDHHEEHEHHHLLLGPDIALVELGTHLTGQL